MNLMNQPYLSSEAHQSQWFNMKDWLQENLHIPRSRIKANILNNKPSSNLIIIKSS